jgi:deoxyribose-phosphate aldolase
MSPELISNYAAKIDHTLLKPDATLSQIKQLCQEAEQHQFAAVCVAPCWLNYLDQFLKTPTISKATVISFPHGNAFFLEKFNTSFAYFNKGADELDVVINIGLIKSGEWSSVEGEIELLGQLRQSKNGNLKIKYIVEVGYLTDDELFKVADLLIKHKIDYIKTCTGYGPRGVTVDDIVKIKKHVGDAIKIKASGGIKDCHSFLQLIEAGADRLGTSSSIHIMEVLGNIP